MSFCPNCGNEIKEDAVFCGNCGKQVTVKTETEKKKINFKIKENFSFNGAKILTSIKTYFSKFYVNYNSLLFKLAMVMFLSMGISSELTGIFNYILVNANSEWFYRAYYLIELGFFFILFGVFSIFLLRKKEKKTVKKSEFLQIIWIVSFILNLLVFIADMSLSEYILYSSIAKNTVTILMVVSTVLLLCKNKPKYPIALILSLLSFALGNTSISSIKIGILTYNTSKVLADITGDSVSFFEIFKIEVLDFILLVAVLFLIRYLIPEKVSKWIIFIPATFVGVRCALDISLTFSGIISFIFDVVLIAIVLLLALGCSKNITYEYDIENKKQNKKDYIKVGAFAICSTLVITFVYLLVSAIVCGTYINAGIKKWKKDIINCSINSWEWDIVNDDIFKYKSDKFVEPFVEDYYVYEAIEDNLYTMEKIINCYRAYATNTFGSKSAEIYSSIHLNDEWEYYEVLLPYYKKYVEMQPNEEKVSATLSMDANSRKITITIKNDNPLPLSECNVRCDFTIMYVTVGYSTNLEFGRGSEEFVIEDVSGKSEKTETFYFDPDEYYDGYRSYINAILDEYNITVQSIE